MKNIRLFTIFKSNYCKLAFILSLVIVSLLMPEKIFYGYYSIIGALFIISTSFLMTCFVRNIKEKTMVARSNGASIMGIISVIIGFGALESCLIGAPVCGASVGAGFLALLFPNFALSLFESYSLLIIILSIIIQFLALYFMNCFVLRKVRA